MEKNNAAKAEPTEQAQEEKKTELANFIEKNIDSIPVAKDQDRVLTDEEAREYEKELEEFKAHKKRKHQQMQYMQNLPYEIKVARAKIRVREFIETCASMGYETHVSVGGVG